MRRVKRPLNLANDLKTKGGDKRMVEEQKQPYVMIYFPRQNKAVFLDRDYHPMGEDIKEHGRHFSGLTIIEMSRDFFPSAKMPEWAEKLAKNGERHIAFWNNLHKGI